MIKQMVVPFECKTSGQDDITILYVLRIFRAIFNFFCSKKGLTHTETCMLYVFVSCIFAALWYMTLLNKSQPNHLSPISILVALYIYILHLYTATKPTLLMQACSVLHRASQRIKYERSLEMLEKSQIISLRVVLAIYEKWVVLL